MTKSEFLTTIARLVQIYRLDPTSLYYIIDGETPSMNVIAVTRKSITDMLMICVDGITEETLETLELLELLDFRALSEAPVKGCIISTKMTVEMAMLLAEKISPAYIHKYSPKIHMPS